MSTCPCPKYEMRFPGGRICYCGHVSEDHGPHPAVIERPELLDPWYSGTVDAARLSALSQGKGKCTRSADVD